MYFHWNINLPERQAVCGFSQMNVREVREFDAAGKNGARDLAVANY
jgi:hypothetical protein